MILIGELSLWVALLMAAWAATVVVRRRRDCAAPTSSPAASAASTRPSRWSSSRRSGSGPRCSTHDFSLQYVASNTSANMPKVYIFAAFWGGQAGSMLFWALILVDLLRARDRGEPRQRTRADAVGHAARSRSILLFFIATTCFGATRSTRLDFVPADGRGMNPQLQNPGMAIHPPNLYLGYVATAIPFAFAIAALVTRRLDAEWLGVGAPLVAGLLVLPHHRHHARHVVGVRRARDGAATGRGIRSRTRRFLPWLTGTAFLHSIMIQEKRGMLRKWNVVLVVDDLPARDLRHLHHAQRHHRERALVRAVAGGQLVRDVLLRRDRARRSTSWRRGSRTSRRRRSSRAWSAARRRSCTTTSCSSGSPSPCSGARSSRSSASGCAARRSRWARRSSTRSTSRSACCCWRSPASGRSSRGARRPCRTSSGSSRVPVPFGLAVGALLVRARHAELLRARRLHARRLRRRHDRPGVLQGDRRAARDARRVARRSRLVRLVARNRRRYGGYIVHAGIVILFCAFAGLAFKKEHDVTLKRGRDVTS